MAGNASITNIKPPSQEALIKFSESCKELFRSNWGIKDRLRNIDLLYSRETDLTNESLEAKMQNLLGNAKALQNITVPVVMPQVESAVTYQASVFLTGHPMFAVVAPPKFIDVALQMEAVIEDEQIKGGWVSELQKVMRDGFKYNLAFAEVNWTAIKTPSITTTVDGAKPVETVWEGNKIKHLDLYNTFWDTRVKPTEVSTEGEFAGYVRRLSRTALKSFINSLPEVIIGNTVAAYESQTPNDYHVPHVHPLAFGDVNSAGSHNWIAWAGIAQKQDPAIHYKDSYELTTIYARIIPKDFNLKVPAENTPQVWKFLIVNNSVLIYAERQTNAHNLIPMLAMQPYDDGLGYQTKSLAENVAPMQSISSTLMNSVLAGRRRSVYDRTVYDPSKINPKDMNSPNPISNIPVKPSAYGTDLRSAFAAFPYNDNNTGNILQEAGAINSLADIVTGQNKAQQGQFVKGNKTREEYSDIMSNANGRSQNISLTLEAQFFTPVKEIIKINILQYQGGVTLYNETAKKEIAIDPVALRKAILSFKVSDGLLPSDKLINGTAFQTALQVLGASPQLAAEYNLGQLVSYLFKSQGANIGDFEKPAEQKAFEAAMQQWQQAAMMYLEQGQEFKAPQPLPADYGLDPRTGAPTNEEPEPPTILEQVMQMEAPQNANPTE